MGIGKEHVINAVQILRQNIESGAVSAALGAIHADMGLDFGKVPADVVIAALANSASLMFSQHEIARDLLNIGTAANNAFMFRSGYNWIAEKKRAKGLEPSGNMPASKMAGEDDDPIVQAARNI
jgi:hypothetical protein